MPPAGGTTNAPANFSVRLRGGIYLPTAGDYTFYVTSDDGSYLWVDGNAGQLTPTISSATVSNGGGHGSLLKTGTITGLGAGWHNVQLLYGDSGGGNSLTLEYSGPTTTRQVVPSSALCTGYRLAPASLVYSPATQQTPYQTSVSSGTPTTGSGNSAVSNYTVANAGSLPAGITSNAATSVLTAAATVLPGTYSVDVAATNEGGTTTFAGVYTFSVAAPCGGIDPYGNPAQPGLLAEYYRGYFNDQQSYFTNNAAFALGSPNNPARIQRVEGAPDYRNDGAWSASGLNLFTAGVASTSDAKPSAFSARYRGKIYISVAGTYTFYLVSDDGSFLAIDGSATAQTLAAPYTVDNGGGHALRTVSGTATVNRGLAQPGAAVRQRWWHQLHVAAVRRASGQRLRAAGYSGCRAVLQQQGPAAARNAHALRRPGPSAVVAVSWATTSEQGSASFEVERSADGATFTKIGQVAAVGTTSQGRQYQLLDRAPLTGLSCYRLRQVDLDGTAHYSSVVPVQLATSATAPLLTLALNPTTGRLTVQLVQATAQAATLQVLDALGRTVYQQGLPAAATQEQTLDLQTLPAGVYLVRVTSAAGVATQRLVRQ